MAKPLAFPHIKQSDVMECGTTCLAIFFKSYGYYDVRHFLNQHAKIDSEGIDLYTMSEIAGGFGFESDGYQMEYQHFKDNEIKDEYPCEYRGQIEVKNRGSLKMYFLS